MSAGVRVQRDAAAWRFHLKPLFGSWGRSPSPSLLGPAPILLSPAHLHAPTKPESEKNLFNPNSCSRCFWC